MKRWITKGDFIDVYSKLKQRGADFILSKLNPSALSRTKSAFDTTANLSSNWWIIPEVRKRWNDMITGNPDLDYENYFIDKYLKNKSQLNMISIGCGVASHEIKFAQSGKFNEVVCVDLVESLLQEGQSHANELGITNMTFVAEDINQLTFDDQYFDVILFHSSLHHFYDIESLLLNKVRPWLKSNGFLIVNEYVGADRLQYPKHQIDSVNSALKRLPQAFKVRYKTNLVKKKYYGSGYLRMIIADPSECVESSRIRPLLNQHFSVIEERDFGGNILMPALKDISHNFLIEDASTKEALKSLFEAEDVYLKDHESDFYFGIYKQVS